MTDLTDAELIHAAESEAGAFGELYRRHVSTVHGWFRRRLAWAASDLTAEAFAQAWLSRRSFRDEAGGSALPWLLGIARNVARESARRNEVETRRVAGSGCLPTSRRTTVTRRSRNGSRRARRSRTHSGRCPSMSGKRSSFASWKSFRTTTSPRVSVSARLRRGCVSLERSGASRPCP